MVDFVAERTRMNTSNLDTEIAKLKTTNTELEEERKLLVKKITDLLLWMAKNLPSDMMQRLPCNCEIYRSKEFAIRRESCLGLRGYKLQVKPNRELSGFYFSDGELETLSDLLINQGFLENLTKMLEKRKDLFKTASEKIKLE